MLDRVDFAARTLELVRPYAPALPADDAAARTVLLGDAGLRSMSAVKLMLALEAEFQVAIPDAALTPENFATVESIATLIASLR